MIPDVVGRLRHGVSSVALAALLTVACREDAKSALTPVAAQAGSAGNAASAAGTSAAGASGAAAGSAAAAGAGAASPPSRPSSDAGSAGVATAGAGGISGTPAGAASGAAGSSGSGTAGASAAAGSGAAACSLTYVTGNNRSMLQHQDRMRRFNVYVPSTLNSQLPVPLVIDLHGNTSTAAQEQSGSGWQQKADKEGFIVAFPDGIGSAWNVGNCCGQALSENVDDVGFVRAVVAAVSSKACIDAKRVYATGISNGAGLSHRLACEAADVFAAIAAASADLVTDPCKPARPIAELSVRGESDTLVAYAGGNTGSTGWYSPGAKGTLELWKNIDTCTGATELQHEYCQTYKQCAAGVEVSLCSLPGTGHILYDNALDFDVPEVAWEMFKRQPMP